MRPDIYETLPPEVRRLVDAVEAASGIQIEVASQGARKIDKHEVRAFGEQVVGVIVGPKNITIESPTSIEDITLNDYVHDLLHLERTFVQRILQLYPRKLVDGSDAANTDNWLEHVVIYKRQIELCPGYQEKLDAWLTIFWRECPWNHSGISLRFNLLTRYMITHRYGMASSRKAMADALGALSPGFSVRSAARRCLACVNEKRNFVSAFFDECQLPKERFWLRRFESPGQQFSCGPL